MANLGCRLAGIQSPNPFWLAAGPPTDKAYNVIRGFRAGWGGAVWKTVGEDPPCINVSFRYGSLSYASKGLVGFNNIELISDRPLHTNLREIGEVKRQFPDRALVVSISAPFEEQSWRSLVRKVEATGADGIELNVSCPHGISEQGMGATIGQVPDGVETVTRWCRDTTRMPILVKLTPNVTDIREPARAARAGGANGVALINTINSLIGVDLDSMTPMPAVDGKGTHGGYCGPAVKPIALHMVAEIARDSLTKGLPISGMGGITNWHDVAEFLALGASNVQVCTAVMHQGFSIVNGLIDGLSRWMDQKGYRTLDAFIGKALPNVTQWEELNLNYKVVSHIDQEKCIRCGRCYTACEDTSHQAISVTDSNGTPRYEVNREACVGCSLCYHVCPVPGCISLEEKAPALPPLSWRNHPSNTLRTS